MTAPAHPFSPETPVFNLENCKISDHDETDIYGTDYELTFKSGNDESIYSLTLGLAHFRVGGSKNNPDQGGIAVRYDARIFFPTIRAAQLEGSMITEVEPTQDELVVVAYGLMAILANKKIVIES